MRTNLSVEEALEAVLEAEGPYASGRLTYPAGGDLRVDLPLPPLEGRFRGRVTPLAGERTLLEAFGPLKATVSVESFSQVNPLAAGALLEEARTLVFGGRRALELYAGSGLFSLLLFLFILFILLVFFLVLVRFVAPRSADGSRLLFRTVLILVFIMHFFFNKIFVFKIFFFFHCISSYAFCFNC